MSAEIYKEEGHHLKEDLMDEKKDAEGLQAVDGYEVDEALVRRISTWCTPEGAYLVRVTSPSWSVTGQGATPAEAIRVALAAMGNPERYRKALEELAASEGWEVGATHDGVVEDLKKFCLSTKTRFMKRVDLENRIREILQKSAFDPVRDTLAMEARALQDLFDHVDDYGLYVVRDGRLVECVTPPGSTDYVNKEAARKALRRLSMRAAAEEDE